MPAAENIHATLVANGGEGVLLCGGPGAGKSDLALRLLSRDWQLVADDRVLISRLGETVSGTAPAAIAGLLEVRGVGIVSVPFLPSAGVRLVVDLVARREVERLPEPGLRDLLGITICTFKLHPFEASAPDKLELLLRRVISA